MRIGPPSQEQSSPCRHTSHGKANDHSNPKALVTQNTLNTDSDDLSVWEFAFWYLPVLAGYALLSLFASARIDREFLIAAYAFGIIIGMILSGAALFAQTYSRCLPKEARRKLNRFTQIAGIAGWACSFSGLTTFTVASLKISDQQHYVYIIVAFSLAAAAPLATWAMIGRLKKCSSAQDSSRNEIIIDQKAMTLPQAIVAISIGLSVLVQTLQKRKASKKQDGRSS